MIFEIFVGKGMRLVEISREFFLIFFKARRCFFVWGLFCFFKFFIK